MFYFDVINVKLKNSSDKLAIEYASRLREHDYGTRNKEISKSKYIGSAEGVDVYYNYKTSTYFFSTGLRIDLNPSTWDILAVPPSNA